MPYRIGTTVSISHPYFDKNQCGLLLVPTNAAAHLLRKCGILLKRQSNTSWYLLKQGSRLPDANQLDDDVLHFYLTPQSPDFYLFTKTVKVDKPSWQLQMVQQHGVYALLAVPTLYIAQQENEEVNICCECKEKQWEIICIPKYTSITCELKLAEEKGRLMFEFVETLTIPGEVTPAFRFVSTQAVPLKSSYNYCIQLWKVKRTGLQLISGSIHIPQANSTSIINSNMITSYLYF